MKQLMLAYKNMIGRCHKESHQAFKNYGARGIEVCKEWRNSRQEFIDWALGNGFKDGLTLDRSDNDGPYSPANCRWITMKQQQSNRRSNRFIEFDGETKTKTITQWAEYLGVRPDTLARRIDIHGMPISKALSSESYKRVWRHGTRAGYDLHKCKCQECRDMHNKRMRDARAKRRHDAIGYAAIAAELGVQP